MISLSRKETSCQLNESQILQNRCAPCVCVGISRDNKKEVWSSYDRGNEYCSFRGYDVVYQTAAAAAATRIPEDSIINEESIYN